MMSGEILSWCKLVWLQWGWCFYNSLHHSHIFFLKNSIFYKHLSVTASIFCTSISWIEMCIVPSMKTMIFSSLNFLSRHCNGKDVLQLREIFRQMRILKKIYWYHCYKSTPSTGRDEGKLHRHQGQQDRKEDGKWDLNCWHSCPLHSQWQSHISHTPRDLSRTHQKTSLRSWLLQLHFLVSPCYLSL